jgi:hypothetical protein
VARQSAGFSGWRVLRDSAQAGLVVLLLASCTTGRRAPPAPVAPATPVGINEFTVADNVLDTWNTIGQIIVRLDGAEYESRAQMLGIYAVRYRGERFLLRTEAQVLAAGGQHTITRVLALGLDGKPDRSPAAMALLAILQQRIPMEIDKYRQPITVPKRLKR